MKKFKILTCALLLISMQSFGTFAAINPVPNDQQVEKGKISAPTAQEREQTKAKLIDNANYIKQKSMSRSSNESKVLSNVKQQIQPYSTYCGPTAAYNTVNGVVSIDTLAKELMTSVSDGTIYPGNWKYTLDKYKPGNNYLPLRGTDYGSDTWSTQMKNSIIQTIDGGYPVIADVQMMMSDSSTWLNSNYGYASTAIYHYVTVSGYDDLPQTNPSLYKIVDSNQRKEIPLVYWVDKQHLGNATKPLGLMW